MATPLHLQVGTTAIPLSIEHDQNTLIVQCSQKQQGETALLRTAELASLALQMGCSMIGIKIGARLTYSIPCGHIQEVEKLIMPESLGAIEPQ